MIKSIQRWAMIHRAKAKTLTWRAIASTDTFLLGWAIITFTGDGVTGMEIAGLIAGFEVLTKMFLYWSHEKAWQRVPHVETQADTTYQSFRSMDRGTVQAVHNDRTEACIVRWGPKNEAKKRARVSRGKYRCDGCGAVGPATLPPLPGNKRRRNNAAVDHVDPVVDPSVGFTSWDEFIERLFCELSNFQVLCWPCHEEKTKLERAIQTERKRKEREDAGSSD